MACATTFIREDTCGLNADGKLTVPVVVLTPIDDSGAIVGAPIYISQGAAYTGDTGTLGLCCTDCGEDAEEITTIDTNANGSVTITTTTYDENGNVIATDSVTVTPGNDGYTTVATDASGVTTITTFDGDGVQTGQAEVCPCPVDGNGDLFPVDGDGHPVIDVNAAPVLATGAPGSAGSAFPDTNPDGAPRIYLASEMPAGVDIACADEVFYDDATGVLYAPNDSFQREVVSAAGPTFFINDIGQASAANATDVTPVVSATIVNPTNKTMVGIYEIQIRHAELRHFDIESISMNLAVQVNGGGFSTPVHGRSRFRQNPSGTELAHDYNGTNTKQAFTLGPKDMITVDLKMVAFGLNQSVNLSSVRNPSVQLTIWGGTQ